MSSRFGRIRLQVLLSCSFLFLLTAPGVLTAQQSGEKEAKEYPKFRVDGQFRLRFEADGRTVGVDPDAAVLSRIRLGGGVLLADWIDVYAQFQDSRSWGSELNTLTDKSADLMDMHQVFAVLGSSPSFKAKLGRQEVNLGDQRLVGAVDWSNTGRSFDG
ncbi:MAG: alginate export family protein, partial [Gemmatimonadetes bacterium]|nr:alginate export family protein [Gemmatimonadota bacterium]